MHKRVFYTPLDFILISLLLAAAGYVFYRIAFHLDYSWNWHVIPQYLFRYDVERGRWVSNYLIDGLVTTIRLSLWAGILALVLGFFFAVMRLSSSLFLRLFARCYIELMRNLPPVVIIFLFYFFLADQFLPLLHLEQVVSRLPPPLQRIEEFLFGDPAILSPFVSAMITLAAFESAYVAEIFRAGIESVENHQREAAYALGLKNHQTMRHIILPQALIRVLPPLSGQLISLIKDSAIVSVISIQELTYQGTQLMASTYMTIEVWTTIALLYLLLTFPCSVMVSYLESRFARS
ncbi:amino acid ABC transporter permease [Desulfogranum japonicum]|uniref:amino acid ABC transporter permease n=1 Tax=Desulfogranum japonicum TaxID=231447 RepID=UPI0003F66514|nr:amino acid ABC transporter permease [Desulfogranum japonicum]